MIEKEYTTIEQQIEILRKRKLKIDPKDEGLLKTYLLEYGYERVITGSNSLFKTLNNNEYDKNSKAKHLMMAFDIDRNISSEIFKYLSKSAEIKISTIIANTIAEILSKNNLQKNGLIFGIKDDDYEIIFPNYKNKNDIWNLKKWIAGESIQNGLYDLEIKEAQKDLEDSTKEIKKGAEVKINIENNINEFKEKNNIYEFQAKWKKWSLYLPIWKIANTWNLASSINIFKRMDEKKQNEIIKNASPKFENLKINPREFTEILCWIKNFRNMLAHNYSVYKMKYIIQKTKYNFNDLSKLIDFIKKLKKAEIIQNNINSNGRVKTGLITFVKLLEVFLNIEDNKIQKAIEKIIEDKFNRKINDKKDHYNQLEKMKEIIQEIINKNELKEDDVMQLKEVKEKIEKIIENKFNDKNELQKDEIKQLEKVKRKIKDIIYEQVYFSK